LIQDTKFRNFATGRLYKINQQLSCTSKNVIYLAACDKCKNQYVGSTSTEFKVRFRNDESSMLNNKRTCELVVHYNSFERQICQISFIVIEQIVNHRSGIHLQQLILTRDAYWTLPLFSLHPHGLNKRWEIKSKNHICYNRLISFYCSPNFPRIYRRHSITVELLAIVVTFNFQALLFALPC